LLIELRFYSRPEHTSTRCRWLGTFLALSSVLAFLVVLNGCGTAYENTAIKSWGMMKSGEIDAALKNYEKNVTSNKDKLLKLMDEGILLRVAKRYEESNQKFFAAAKIIELNGYLALGEQAVTLVTNEKQTTYQGEDFEKVLVHVYLGLNYLAMSDYENAIVETRKVNELLYMMISKAKRPYELNAFARYLNAMLFENEGEEDDAYIDYKNTVKIDPILTQRFPIIHLDLLRLAKKLDFTAELDAWKNQFGNAEWDQAQKTLKDHDGAVVLLYESGKSPRKFSSREYHQAEGKGGSAIEVMIPVSYYERRKTLISRVKMSVANQSAETVVLNDIEKTAIQHLKDRMGRMIAKALLTAGVKAGIATGVGKATHSTELGLLTGLALFLASEADTRSWLLLPGGLQVAKIFLPPGRYDIDLSYQDDYHNVISSDVVSGIEVKPGKATFIQKRSFD